jgi:outer membrane protein TolC
VVLGAELQAAAARIPLARQGVAAAEKSLEYVLARFESGVDPDSARIALELFDAQDALAESRLDLAGALVDFNVVQVQLLAAAGALSRDALRPAAR